MAIKELAGRIEKRFGKDAIAGIQRDIDFVHSGSIALDEALGGGYAVGRIIEIYGGESSGKTTAALHAVAEIQKTGKAVGYVDVEHAIDLFYVRDVGVDLSEEKWIMSQPDNAEEAMEIVREMCSEEAIGAVVLDSVAGLVPKATLQGEAGDAKVALVARLMSSQLNILKNICNKNKCLLICINQIRDKVGGGFGSFGGATSTTTGGRALKFYASQRLEMARIGSDKEGEEIVSNKTRVTVKKNKVAPPFRKCEISLRFGVGFDKIQEVVELAVEKEICRKKGSFYYLGDDYRLGQGIAQVRETLQEDPELYKEIYNLVKEKADEDRKNNRL